jgi:hypothetical protein
MGRRLLLGSFDLSPEGIDQPYQCAIGGLNLGQPCCKFEGRANISDFAAEGDEPGERVTIDWMAPEIVFQRGEGILRPTGRFSATA